MPSHKDNILENPYIKFGYKALLAGFLLAGAVYRYEVKMEEIGNSIIKKMDEHILRDQFEKEAMVRDITELKKAVAKMEDEAREYMKSEFIRPEDIRRKKYEQR